MFYVCFMYVLCMYYLKMGLKWVKNGIKIGEKWLAEIKKKCSCLLRKRNYSTDVRGDRIPILSKNCDSFKKCMTESERCPPDPSMNELN